MPTAALSEVRKAGLASRIEYIAQQEGHISATRRAMEFLVEQLNP